VKGDKKKRPARAKPGPPSGPSGKPRLDFADFMGHPGAAPQRGKPLDLGKHGTIDPLDPDVLLNIPRVAVEKIHLEVENLDAVVTLRLDVLDMVSLHVGADVHLGAVTLDLEGLEAEAVLKVQLERVQEIVADVLASAVDAPDLVGGLRRELEP
jgi:hypothetical protein